MSYLGTGTLSSHRQGALAVGIRASKAVARTRVLRNCVLLLNCHKSLRFACASNENWGVSGRALWLRNGPAIHARRPRARRELKALSAGQRESPRERERERERERVHY